MPVAMQHAVQYATRTATAVPARAAQQFRWTDGEVTSLCCLDVHIVMSIHEHPGYPIFSHFFLLNDEQMSNKVGVEHQPVDLEKNMLEILKMR